MDTKFHRLLNEGEKIKQGDEVLHLVTLETGTTKIRWEKVIEWGYDNRGTWPIRREINW